MTLDELKAIEAAATPGPWTLINLEAGCYHLENGVAGPSSFEDALLIAAARTMLPRLIAVAEAARLVVSQTKIGHDVGDLQTTLAALETP